MSRKAAYAKVGQKLKETAWQNMGTKKRSKMRRRYRDTDRDGVPDRWDCNPKNKYRQDDYSKWTPLTHYSRTAEDDKDYPDKGVEFQRDKHPLTGKYEDYIHVKKDGKWHKKW